MFIIFKKTKKHVGPALSKGIKAKTEPSKPHVDPITGVCKFQLTLTGRDSGGNSSQLLALRYDVKPPTSVLHHPALGQ